MRTPVIAALLALAAAGQQPEPTVKFSTTSSLVVVDVSVRDRSGKVIEDLKKDNFTVLEDGKPQAISVFEFQKIGGEELPLLPPALKTEPIERKSDVISIPAPGTVQYQDKRLLVLFFDLSMPPADALRAQESALKFINEQMTSGDIVAIMSFSGGFRVDQDFTPDRDQLRDAITAFPIGQMAEFGEEGDDADEEAGQDTGSAFIADETEFNIFNTDRKLAALESAVQQLAALPEKKALVYFSSGISKTGVENQAQLRATVNAAVKANVSFYPVDSRGLVAGPPGGDASKAMARGTGIFSGYAQKVERIKLSDQQETLSTLAADTGGKAFLDSNDLAMGIVQAQKDVRSYYIVGYYSTNAAEDGRFRRIQVKLAGQPQARLQYRPGYFAKKEFGKFNSTDKEQQLEEALRMGDPFTDLRLAMEVDWFRINDGTYFVPVSLKIPGSVVTLEKKGDTQATDFDFIGQILDDKRKMAGSVRDGIKIKLSGADAEQLAHRSLQYDTGFTLAPGKYRIKFLARDNVSGKMGTFETRFEIPDFSVPADALKMSPVVWSSQREPLAAAVGSAEKEKKLLEMSPLVHDGQKLIPSITRTFRKDQNLYVYFEVYGTNAVAASLSIFRGKTKAFESDPLRVTQLAPIRDETVPVHFQLPLKQLDPGRYTCQLNIVDEEGRKVTFARAPMVVMPN